MGVPCRDHEHRSLGKCHLCSLSGERSWGAACFIQKEAVLVPVASSLGRDGYYPVKCCRVVGRRAQQESAPPFLGRSGGKLFSCLRAYCSASM